MAGERALSVKLVQTQFPIDGQRSSASHALADELATTRQPTHLLNSDQHEQSNKLSDELKRLAAFDRMLAAQLSSVAAADAEKLNPNKTSNRTRAPLLATKSSQANASADFGGNGPIGSSAAISAVGGAVARQLLDLRKGLTSQGAASQWQNRSFSSFVTKYLVEWAECSSMQNSNTLVIYNTGARIVECLIDRLEQDKRYFVRVAAGKSQGLLAINRNNAEKRGSVKLAPGSRRNKTQIQRARLTQVH